MTLILSGTDGLSDVDGSAATPAIRGTDANTGIFFGADIIGFAEGGAEVARFNADAQFVAAAGTASLPVITTTGDVNTGIFFPAADQVAITTGGTQRAVVDASGNVGIGTTSPSTSNTAGASFVPGTSTVASMTGSNGSGQLLLGNNGNGSNLATNDSCGMIAFKGRFNGTFGGGNDVASIIGTYTGNGTTRSGAIRFLTLDSGTEAERARITSGGDLLVGTTSSNARVTVKGTASESFGGGIQWIKGTSDNRWELVVGGDSKFYLGYGSGTTPTSVGNFATNGVYTATSDVRKKKDISYEFEGLSLVQALKPAMGRMLDDEASFPLRPFFIAQDVKPVLPSLVSSLDPNPETPDPFLGVDYASIAPVLVKAIQEQQAIITTLTDRITALEAPATGTQA